MCANGLDLRQLGHLDILLIARSAAPRDSYYPRAPTVMICDETRPGRAVSELALPGLPDRISVRELIRSRVREEVAQANLDRQSSHRLLVQPTDTEASLNGYRLRTPRLIDWEAQAEVALTASIRTHFS